jgi:hypothetical protein
VNVDDLLRDTLREQAAEQPPAGPGFADWVLAVRRRRRTRRLVTVVAAAVAVAAVAVGVPLLDSGKRTSVRRAWWAGTGRAPTRTSRRRAS